MNHSQRPPHKTNLTNNSNTKNEIWWKQVGTPKYLANAMKSKGLQRLRWYCQACQKQCRDENGFKCHTQSEPHLRQLLLIGENAGHHISNFSSEFQHDFVQLLSRRWVCPWFRCSLCFLSFGCVEDLWCSGLARVLVISSLLIHISQHYSLHSLLTLTQWWP